MPGPIVTEVQTPSSAITPSVVRTTIPLLVGLLATWLVEKVGGQIDTVLAGALITAGGSWLYYFFARLMEVYASPKWGYILGIGKLPVYPDKAPPVTVQVPATPSRGDAGALSVGMALIVAGLLLIVVTAVVGGSSLLWGLGLILLIVGVVLLLVPTSSRRHL